MFDPPPANALNPDRVEATKFSEKKAQVASLRRGSIHFAARLSSSLGEGDDRPQELFRFRLSGWLLARLPLCLWLRFDTAGLERSRQRLRPDYGPGTLGGDRLTKRCVHTA